MYQERGSDVSSNLVNFLDGVTPVVNSQYLPKNSVANLDGLWHPQERETVEYFDLIDLWRSYDEWSVYGAGTKVQLNSCETVHQYYVPYLSAIQIFISNMPVSSRRDEIDQGEYKARGLFSNNLSKDIGFRKNPQSWDDQSLMGLGLKHDNVRHVNDRLGILYFQYFERSSPYQRVPFSDKIMSFYERFPGLTTLRSIDISPASWMSVAWYPIYHIPMGRTIKDLSACFLTYHTLSNSFLDMGLEDQTGNTERKIKKRGTISLPPFGLATYKMHGNVWLSDQTGRDRERLISLLSVADSWLKQLRVHQHDFNFFTSWRYR